MKLVSALILTAFMAFSQQPAPTEEPAAAPSDPQQQNVNSQYTVESVRLAGRLQKKLSRNLRRDVESLVGQRFDPQLVQKLAERMGRQVHVVVAHRLEKGNAPEQVRVVYEPEQKPWQDDQTRVTKLAYHQKQGVSGGVQVGFEVAGTRFDGGVLSDADTLLEREAGFNVGVSRRIGDRVKIRFEFEGLHQQWNPATETALLAHPGVPGIYRERYHADPSIVIYLTPGLSLISGLSFEQFQTQYPATIHQAANAITTSIRYRRRLHAYGSASGQEWDTGYSLRAATSVLGSDFAYLRHQWDVRYALHYGPNTISVRGLGGVTGDDSPLFERFTLGDSRNLRGWNKFDVAPIGGTRLAYASVQYSWKQVGVFYDTGSVWDRSTPARIRHSAGFLIAFDREQEGPYLAVGFPIHGGSIVPIFMLGMNF